MSYTGEHAEEIARATALLQEAHHAVALTGAGSSTPSGIPDFRSPGSGMWEQRGSTTGYAPWWRR